jgi:hypothetical protein
VNRHHARAMLALTLLGLFQFAGCSGSSDERGVTAAPVAAEGADDSRVTAQRRRWRQKQEAGPSATPFPAPAQTPYSATLTWSPPPLNVDGSSASDIIAYRIYFGENASSLTQSIQVPGGTTTGAVVSGLPAGTYYFAMAAVNSLGELSAQTNVVSVTVP